MEQNICDYKGYDYKNEFWVNQNRNYEHHLELKVVNSLLKKFKGDKKIILDAGCGFGRLMPAYTNLFNKCYLVDYAQHLLDDAKKSLKREHNITFVKQSLYELALNEKVDAIISIRTLHHLDDLETLFEKYNQALNNDGIIILDIPNYYHLKNRILKPSNKNEKKYKLSENFYNYDPKHVIDMLIHNNFKIVTKKQVGLFRVNIIKKIIPAKLLIFFDFFLNLFISRFNVGPSVYVVAKKCG